MNNRAPLPSGYFLFFSLLTRPHAGVAACLGKQLFMGAAFDNLARFQHDDVVCIFG